MMLHSMGLNRRDISKIVSISYDLVSDPFHLPNDQWITDNVSFKNEVFFYKTCLIKNLSVLLMGPFTRIDNILCRQHGLLPWMEK